MKLVDLMDINALEIELQDGFVRERKHPTKTNLTILNYTEQAQYANRWNDVTRQCRGLIVDNVTQDVVARPFPKFLNYGQHAAGDLDLTAPVEVTDKADGSLGILYHDGDDWAIATRGSFESEQAIHATALVRERYRPFLDRIGKGVTRLFEIVYPGNRIVLDYGDLDDLILLGGVGVESGRTWGPDLEPHWEGPRADVFEYATLAEALEATPRPNAEGLVVRFTDDEHANLMVKIKQDDYVALHRIVTGLSERSAWQALADGTFRELVAALPDEFHDWVRDIQVALMDKAETLNGRAHASYTEILDAAEAAEIDPAIDRGWFARIAVEQGDLAPLLFRLLDGKSLHDSIWKRLKPVGHRPMTHRTEDVA